MDDYSALAQRISVGVPGVSGSLVLSRDGLVLGAHPDEVESHAKQAWLRFISLGEPDRSFVEFPDQVWAYVKRGPYAAFALAEPGVRPGVLVDRLEQVLLSAEEGRSRRDPLRVPDQAAAPSGKPRTSLHPQTETPAPSDIAAIAAEAIRPAPEPSSSVGAGPVVAPGDVDGIATALAELERRWRNGKLQAPSLTEAERVGLSRRKRAERLAALLWRVA